MHTCGVYTNICTYNNTRVCIYTLTEENNSNQALIFTAVRVNKKLHELDNSYCLIERSMQLYNEK